MSDLKVAVITRSKDKTGDEGTPGQIAMPSGKIYHSLELPWRDNAHDRSCIKPAPDEQPIRYHVKMLPSARWGRPMYHILDVEGRAAVEQHPGDLAGDVTKGYAADVDGCQLFGDGVALWREGEKVESHTLTHDQHGITNTKATLEAMHAELGDEYILEVRWA